MNAPETTTPLAKWVHDRTGKEPTRFNPEVIRLAKRGHVSVDTIYRACASRTKMRAAAALLVSRATGKVVAVEELTNAP